MTYLEKYMALATEEDILEAATEDARIAAVFLGGNPDRLKAIEDAANEAIKQKGGESYDD